MAQAGARTLLTLCSLLIAGAAAAQEPVEAFFKGKQINVIVGSSAGGGYDTYARLLARHVGSHIPGAPAIVVQNMSGAGSSRAAGYIYSVAPKDGTAIGAIFPGAIMHPLIGEGAVQHDPNKLIYLGSANSDYYICVARSDAGVKKFEDAFTRELILGATGDGATTRDLPTLLNNVLGTKFRIITGYAGSREIGLAIERNEVQGTCGIGWTAFVTLYPEWFTRGTVKVIAQLSLRANADLARIGAPLAVDFAKRPDDRAVLELVLAQSNFGRPFVLPPGVPVERVTTLRKAFIDALNHQSLRSEADRMKLDLEPMSGDDLQSLVRRIYATPAPIVERARQALAAKPQR